jgi:hypothetical protein
VFQACRAWLLQQELGTVFPNTFRIAINKEILPRLMILTQTGIGRTSTYNWLRRLGFYNSELKKGVYVNGHERKDVVKYRQTIFLPLMAKLQSYARQYIEMPSDKWQVVELLLPLGI